MLAVLQRHSSPGGYCCAEAARPAPPWRTQKQQTQKSPDKPGFQEFSLPCGKLTATVLLAERASAISLRPLPLLLLLLSPYTIDLKGHFQFFLV